MPDGAGDLLLERYDDVLRQFGDTPEGALYPTLDLRLTTFDVMLSIVEERTLPVVLCDLGCGTGELLNHLRRRGLQNVEYLGVDRSALAISHARAKFPDARFLEIDVLSPQADLRQLACDYLVANGLFTVKFGLSDELMRSFLEATIRRVWPHVRRGLAFNVMSPIVDWRDDELFYLSMDEAARLLHDVAGRNVWMRADYGHYQYAAFARKP